MSIQTTDSRTSTHTIDPEHIADLEYNEGTVIVDWTVYGQWLTNTLGALRYAIRTNDVIQWHVAGNKTELHKDVMCVRGELGGSFVFSDKMPQLLYVDDDGGYDIISIYHETIDVKSSAEPKGETKLLVPTEQNLRADLYLLAEQGETETRLLGTATQDVVRDAEIDTWPAETENYIIPQEKLRDIPEVLV